MACLSPARISLWAEPIRFSILDQDIARGIAMVDDSPAEPDIHPRGGACVAGRVDAVTAVQRVGTRPAFEDVVAGRIADQGVVMGGAGEVFNGIEGIAFGIAA